MLHIFMSKVTKFQLPTLKRFSIMAKTFSKDYHAPSPPMSNRVKWKDPRVDVLMADDVITTLVMNSNG